MWTCTVLDHHEVRSTYDLPNGGPHSRVVFFGKTGVGKSSTINALFGITALIDHAIACTKAPSAFDVLMHRADGYSQPLRIIDMPGIGESLEADRQYTPYYQSILPIASMLVWITQADTRAYKRDEIFLRQFSQLFISSTQFILALNKVDALGVDDDQQSFCFDKAAPSAAQQRNIDEKIEDVYEIFNGALGNAISITRENIIPYTCAYGWGLENLRRVILEGSNIC